MFQTEQGRALEREIARVLGRWWGWTVHSFGRFSPIDWWAEDDRGRWRCVAEVKARSHSRSDHKTVFLSARKYTDLWWLAERFGVPARFVVLWTDGLGWIDLAAVDTLRHRVAGHNSPRAANDREPVIEVPVAHFHFLPLKFDRESGTLHLQSDDNTDKGEAA